MILRFFKGNTRAALAQAGILVAVIAVIDWRVDLNISFGFLYLFPMLLVGTALPRWQVVLTALFCTMLSDVFDPFPFTLSVALPQDILVFSSLAGTGPVRLRDFDQQPPPGDGKPAPGGRRGSRAARGRRAVGIPHRQQPRGHPDHGGRLPDPARQFRPRTGCFGVAPGQLARAEASAATCRPGPRPVPGRDAADIPHRNAVPRRTRKRRRSSWPTSSSPLTRRPWARAWPRWWWMPPRNCASARNPAWSNFWPARGSWWARFRMRCATCAAPSA